ncbi:hypothetical protein ACHAWF_014341 [Thalassiosira exigua]
MRKRRVLPYSVLLFLLTAVLSAQGSSAQNANAGNANVLEAITICREKLAVDPHFPKIQHSLAQLLDSQISTPENVDKSLVLEVLQLYHAVGQPPTEVGTKRLPPAKIRFEALTRAGTIAKDILHDETKAIEYYSLAMRVGGVDEASLLLAFREVMPLLLASIPVSDRHMEVDISPGGDLTSNTSAENAMQLCDLVEKRFPKESIADEYRGAISHRTNQPQVAYQFYLKAMVKSEENMQGNANKPIDERVTSVANFVRLSILAAAAGREAGDSFQQQMLFLNRADEVSESILICMADVDEQLRETFKDQMVELYNNMGIAEKKQGSLQRARNFFRKALHINPEDGHALVQLASVDDDSADSDGIISSVIELDREYVSALFDGYSSRFESELVDVLHYKGHTLVYDSLQKALKLLGKSPVSIKRIVDLGCGTGLLGELVANEMPWVEVLGVDLSQRMVQISRERKSNRGRPVYASIANEDAGQYLSSVEADSIDCILASDVFIYIGDMSKVLQESFKCLVEGGLVGFTIETWTGPGSGLRLLPSGRFGHSRSYIDEVAKSNGFAVMSWEDCILRQQAKEDVNGATVVLAKHP